MAKKRSNRQEAIREIVRNKDVRTQRMLVDELKAYGFDCTQATISRDIADMGLRKLPEGVYVLAEDLHLQRMVSELVVEVVRTGNQVLVKAQPGTASGIAAAIDAAVEMTKKYEPQEVAAFVNGILGTFVRTEFPDTPAKPEKSDSAGEEE